MYDQLLGKLSRRVSEIHGRAAINRAAEHVGLGSRYIPHDRVLEVVDHIERSVSWFLNPAQLAELHADLASLGGGTSALATESIRVEREADVVVARGRARKLVAAMGASPINMQRVTTIVSELARNIVSYTNGGSIKLDPDQDLGTFTIVAQDRGCGIAKLEQILRGNYKSRTGLGMGILGSKRLADAFKIETGESGTRVEAAVTI